MTKPTLKKAIMLSIVWSAWGMMRWWIAILLEDKLYKEQQTQQEPGLPGRFDNSLGFYDPRREPPYYEMADAWDRAIEKPSAHNWKNWLTSWVRLDAQRAAKFLSFLIILFACLFILTLTILLITITI